ncbi:MAG TPA: hypothetical protein VE999_19500 [Gemmataceae bacterium]|jgi:hypothetical protein|nr:hypothetical protein [Gemmataceae bacterium]
MKDFYSMTPQERWQEDQRQLEASDPWLSPRTLSRDARGNLVQGPAQTVPAGRVSQAEYDRMTYSERVNYAARMSQFSGGK